jgi:hypothetical protein
MSKSKAAPKKPARVAAGPEAAGFARTMGENTGRIVRPMIPLLSFVAAFCALSYLLWRPVYSDSATTGARGRLQSRTIRFSLLSKPRPGWMSREDLEQVADLGLFAANRSVFDANLSRDLAQRYAASAWIERVETVRLRFPAQMEVDVEWRKPAARVNGSTMVLDRSGFVMNLMSDSPAVRDVPRISGVPAQRTEAGKQVAEKELLDALQLLARVREALTSSPGALKVADIQRDAAGMWRVLTDRGPMIYWGSFTDDPPMGEPNTQEKVDLLRRRLCESRDPSSLEYIKVYMPDAPFKPRANAANINNAPRPSAVPLPASTRRSRL